MPNPNPRGPRVPLGVTAVLATTSVNIQVNHCRNPNCKNYGAPAQTKRQKPGPSPDRERAYKRKGTNKGLVPAIQCHACGQSPPLRSHASIAAEIERLIGEDRLRTLEEQTVCLNTDCVNHAHCVAQHRHAYRKYGFSETGERRYRCKSCGSTPRVSDLARLHPKNQKFAVAVFSRIANKSPVRCVVRGARLNSSAAYYRLFDFIHRRCQAHSGAVDRALIDGRMQLPTPARPDYNALNTDCDTTDGMIDDMSHKTHCRHIDDTIGSVIRAGTEITEGVVTYTQPSDGG